MPVEEELVGEVVDDCGVCYQPTTGRVDDEGGKEVFSFILIVQNYVIPKHRNGEDVVEVFDNHLCAGYPIRCCYQKYHPYGLNVHFLP